MSSKIIRSATCGRKIRVFLRGLLVIILMSATLSVYALTCFAESLSFSAYYPSPNATFTSLEVRGRFAVGNIASSGISGVNSVGNLGFGESWLNDSFVLKGHAFDPPVATSKPGEVIYNSTDGRFKFFNGTDYGNGSWVNFDIQPISYTTRCSWGYRRRNCWYCSGSCVPATCGGNTELYYMCTTTNAVYQTNGGVTSGYCERGCLSGGN